SRQDAGSQAEQKEADTSSAPSTEGESPDLAELMESGDETAISLALEKAAEASGVDDIRFSTQVAYYAQQMLKQMGGESLQARLLEALQQGGQEGDAEAQRLIDVRRDATL